MRIHRGDNCIVISGSEKGKKGRIARVLLDEGKVVIEGMNLKKKHQKARKAGQKGQLIEVAMPLSVSTVALMEGGKPVRVGRKLVGEKWVRVSRKTGKEI